MADFKPTVTAIPGLVDLVPLGKGGMAEVYRARRETDGLAVAVKVMIDEAIHNETYVERFEREAETLMALEHPHIVRGYELAVVDGRPYLMMEFVEGANADKLVRENGPLAIDEALHIVRQVAEALGYAHDLGYIHRDVKPSNILLPPEGPAKLSDFGLAKLEGDPSLTIDGTVLGTPHYLAPEQISDSPHVDLRADIYSLGMTLYFLLVGEPAFKGPSIPAVLTRHLTDELRFSPEARERLPEEVVYLVRRMAAKQPERRYENIGEVLQDLAWAKGETKEPCACNLPEERDFYLQDWSGTVTQHYRDVNEPLRLPVPDQPEEHVTLGAGQVLFYEDEKSDDVYWLLEGRIEILRGGRRLVVMEEEGTILGEMAALRGTPRSATARAIGECKLVRIRANELPTYLGKNPTVLKSLLREMAERIDQLSNNVVSSQETVETIRRSLSAIAKGLSGGQIEADEAASLLRELIFFDASKA